jgi:DNA-binding CsgD family transcriptional regulator
MQAGHRRSAEYRMQDQRQVGTIVSAIGMRTSFISDTLRTERNDLYLNVTYFHTFQDEAHLMCELFGSTAGVHFTAMSSELSSRATHIEDSGDAWIVEISSLRDWQDTIPPLLDTRSTPVIVATHDGHWSEGKARSLNVDGWIHIDLTLSAFQLSRLILAAVTSTVVSSSHDSPPQSTYSSDVCLSDITRDNATNLRILNLIAHGLSDKDISTSMCLSTHTVRNRISRMLHNGGFENRTSLALFFSHDMRNRIYRGVGHLPTSSLQSNAY